MFKNFIKKKTRISCKLLQNKMQKMSSKNEHGQKGSRNDRSKGEGSRVKKQDTRFIRP